MTKQKLSETLKVLWKELNSDISKESKIDILDQIHSLVHTHIVKDAYGNDAYLEPCDMVINHFKEALKVNPKYVDHNYITNLAWLLEAVESSSLPLQDNV